MTEDYHLGSLDVKSENGGTGEQKAMPLDETTWANHEGQYAFGDLFVRLWVLKTLIF